MDSGTTDGAPGAGLLGLLMELDFGRLVAGSELSAPVMTANEACGIASIRVPPPVELA
jgi:hypothetical protein